ncbi:hypothetical protein BH10PSE7_BH10PSE7_15500 [soil metagenome]
MPKASPDRQIEVSGRSYTLRYSLKAMAALQDHYGLASIDEVAQHLSDANRMGVNDIVALIWAGLRTHHPEVTQEQTLDLVDELGVAEMTSTIRDAFGAALPRVGAAGEGTARPPQRGR